MLREMDGVSLVVFGRSGPGDVKTLVLDDSMWEELSKKPIVTVCLHARKERAVRYLIAIRVWD
jgi:hypothetical protein